MSANLSLVQQISQALTAVSSLSYTPAKASYDDYEVYVWTLILQAAILEGGNVSFRDVFGNDPQGLVFRTSPGIISSQRAAYTHAVITFPNQPVLEAHIGVKVAGTSNVLHECDVLVLPWAEAETCRVNKTAPRASKAIIAVECKFYTSSDLTPGLARSFIGLLTDCHFKVGLFAANTDSKSVARLLASKKKAWELNVTPSNTVPVDGVRAKFREAFKNFKASN